MCVDIYEASIKVMGFVKDPVTSTGTKLLSSSREDVRLCYKKHAPIPGCCIWDPENIASQAFMVVAKYLEATGNEMLTYQELTKENTSMYVCVVNGLVSARSTDLPTAMLRAICKAQESGM